VKALIQTPCVIQEVPDLEKLYRDLDFVNEIGIVHICLATLSYAECDLLQSDCSRRRCDLKEFRFYTKNL